MNGGLRVWVEQCAVLVYGIRKFGKLERTGPERETEREDFGVSDNGARLEGTLDLLTLTSSSHVPWENLDLVSSLEEEEHRAV